MAAAAEEEDDEEEEEEQECQECNRSLLVVGMESAKAVVEAPAKAASVAVAVAVLMVTCEKGLSGKLYRQLFL